MQLISKLKQWLFANRPAKPTRPPTCPSCRGRGLVCWQIFPPGTSASSMQINAQAYRLCMACGGTGVVPRKVTAGLPAGLAIDRAVRYGRSFRNN